MGADSQHHQQQGYSNQGCSPPTIGVELEHLCGLNHKFYNTVKYHPSNPNLYVYSVGSVVIIEDVNDAHSQIFLRGHDAEISAIALSDGLLATGQVGSELRKGRISPILIWDLNNPKERAVKELTGLALNVTCLSFSSDGRFLLGSGGNCMMYVWDMSSCEVVYSRKCESPLHGAVWGPTVQSETSRYPTYTLMTPFDTNVLINELVFDLRSMAYGMQSHRFQIPAQGLQRKYVVSAIYGDLLLCGTKAGDICVFNWKNRIFRNSLPVVNGGVVSLSVIGDRVYCAGGDGRVKSFQIVTDTHWDLKNQNMIDCAHTERVCSSLSASADGRELLCSTIDGKMWRLLASDLTATLHSSVHSDHAVMASFGSGSDTFATCSLNGEIFMWSLSDYHQLWVARAKDRVAARCLWIAEGEHIQGPPQVIAGYDDGFLRCWSERLLWEIPNAHRGPITTIAESSRYIITAGDDSMIRVWQRNTRELLAQYASHQSKGRGVSQLIIDCVKPHIFHSCSLDKLVVTYDLKLNKPIVQHVTPNSNITGMSQRKDHENEIFTCSNDGRILFWDIDVSEAVGCLQVEEVDGYNRVKLLCTQIAPGGRFFTAGGDNGYLYIWDLYTCKQVFSQQGHTAGITSAIWSPDEKQIVTVATDGVCVWNVFA